MKRFWAVTLILISVFSITSWNAAHLGEYTRDLSELLTQAQAAAATGHWQSARALTDRAFQRWDDKEAYLHITLRHLDINEIQIGFQEVRALAMSSDEKTYSAANQKLLAHIELLYEMEQLNLKNIL